MRATLTIVYVLLAVGSVAFGWHAWDTFRNRGYEFGYYGEFNRVAHAFASIPEVTVVSSWHNSDLALEEFGFDLTVAGRPLELNFGETDFIRSMSREATVAALKSRIAHELGS